MQGENSTITDIKDGIRDVLDKLEGLQNEEITLPFDCDENEDGNIYITPVATNLPASQQFKKLNQLTEKQKAHAEKCLTIHRERFVVKEVINGKHAVERIKNVLLPSVIDSIQGRLESFEGEIFKAMEIIDHHRWDHQNSDYGIQDIRVIATHFEKPLSHHNFKLDNALYEFRELKRLVKIRYHHFTHAYSLWEKIFSIHHEKFPHILSIIEIILAMEWASSTVERDFSTTNRLLTNSRLRLSKTRLNNLLMLRINVPILTKLDPNYESKLVNKAVDIYMSSNRYNKTSSTASSASSHNLNTTGLEDLFRPTNQSLPSSVSELLQDDSYLVISDDEEQEYETRKASLNDSDSGSDMDLDDDED